MFTGLVEEVGQIRRIGRKGEALVLNISAAVIMDDLKIGDSVAVNGVCLTATTLEAGGFTADVMPETYRHTNLSQLQSGSKVNLERAMLSGAIRRSYCSGTCGWDWRNREHHTRSECGCI